MWSLLISNDDLEYSAEYDIYIPLVHTTRINCSLRDDNHDTSWQYYYVITISQSIECETTYTT